MEAGPWRDGDVTWSRGPESMDTFTANGERMFTTMKHHHCGKQQQPPPNPAPESPKAKKPNHITHSGTGYKVIQPRDWRWLSP
jgi:hypothetical protein